MSLEKNTETDPISKGYEPGSGQLILIDVTVFLSILKSFFETADKRVKKKQVQKIVSSKEWFEHYYNRKNGRRVLSALATIDYAHELATAIKLTEVDYDVVFTPKGMFSRSEKKFDVLLLRDSILLKADLKTISSRNPLSIAKRIIEGGEQAPRVVLDIKSDVSSRILIQALRSSNYKNDLIKEIFLFYRSKFYVLPKNLILSNQIFKVLP